MEDYHEDSDTLLVRQYRLGSVEDALLSIPDPNCKFSWGSVGIFQNYGLETRTLCISRSSVTGKAVQVSRYLLSVPTNVLLEWSIYAFTRYNSLLTMAMDMSALQALMLLNFWHYFHYLTIAILFQYLTSFFFSYLTIFPHLCFKQLVTSQISWLNKVFSLTRRVPIYSATFG